MSLFNVTSSTASGVETLTVSYNAQAANLFFAAPDGVSGLPAMRAMVIGDIPFAGLPNGIATLDGGGKVPSSQLPTYTLPTVVTPGSATLANITVDQYGRITSFSSGSPSVGSSTVQVTKSGVSLGTQAANQSAFTYTTVSLTCLRGLIWYFYITFSQAGNADIVIRGTGSDSGTLFYQAVAVTPTTLLVTLPFFYANDLSGQDLFIGWRNNSANSISATLTTLQVERFA